MIVEWPVNVCSEKIVFSPEEACRELNVSSLAADSSLSINGASLDTRTLKPGSLFIALKGLSQDGHDYLEKAFNRGATAALVNREYCERHKKILLGTQGLFKNLIPVENVEKALVALAAWRRRLYSRVVIGVTGSVGKTSTKEMLGYLLTKRFSGLTGGGNFNNQLGLPLTLMALDAAHEFCLAELGASKPGDIHFLMEILKPTHSMITQVSAAHLEGFGSLEAIYQTKLEIAESLAKGGLCIISDHDPVLIEKARRFEREWVLVGESESAHYRLSEVRMEGRFVRFRLAGRQTFQVPATAPFFALNAAMASAMADQLGFRLEDQPPVWEDFCLPQGRFERRELAGGVTVIYDGYNASPASFRRSLEGFKNLQVSGRKVVLFSDMLELGTHGEFYHGELGGALATAGFHFVGAYGGLARYALEKMRMQVSGPCETMLFETAEEAGHFLAGYLKKGDALLLKASRGMRIDKTLKIIEDGRIESLR